MAQRNTSQGATAPALVTGSSDFFRINADFDQLFMVRPGTSARDALAAGSLILTCALSLFDLVQEAQSTDQELGDAMFGVRALFEMAEAVVDATLSGLPAEVGHD